MDFVVETSKRRVLLSFSAIVLIQLPYMSTASFDIVVGSYEGDLEKNEHQY